MSKTKLGFDIGNSSIKIAVVSKRGMDVHEIRLPETMIQDGEIIMPNSFSQFLKKECKKLRIPKGECALVLSPRETLCRTLTMPKMPKDQLMLNLPYEFSEFIRDDADKYFYDYAMCDSGQETNPEDGEQMKLMAAIARKERITQYIRMFSDAGMKLRTLLPCEMALIYLNKEYQKRVPDVPRESCFINIGQHSVRFLVVQDDSILASRQIDAGCASLDMVIADLLGVDPFLANSYKMTNYKQVLDFPECQAVCRNIAVEILKVINFYQFNYRKNQLSGVYLTGGGSAIPQLRAAISDVIDLPILPLADFLPREMTDTGKASVGIYALGVAIA